MSTQLRYEGVFDLTGSGTVFSSYLAPTSDAMVGTFAKLFDEIKFKSVEVTLDGRDFLHNCENQTPSTSLALSSVTWAASNMLTVNPTGSAYVWDVGNAKVLPWSLANPVVSRKFPVERITYITTGITESPGNGGWYGLPRVAAMSASDWQILRMWLGMSGTYNTTCAITHSYIVIHASINVEMRQRKGGS
jgi:hypothetical protein